MQREPPCHSPSEAGGRVARVEPSNVLSAEIRPPPAPPALPATKPVDLAAAQSGLLAEYFDGENMKELRAARIDPVEELAS